MREHFDGMYLSHDAAKGVIETYGMERVYMVLSNTVQLQDWDAVSYTHLPTGMVYPIYRAERKEQFEQLLRADRRNAYLSLIHI